MKMLDLLNEMVGSFNTYFTCNSFMVRDRLQGLD